MRSRCERRCPAPLQAWEWVFGEGIAQGVRGALVVREDTEILLLEEKCLEVCWA